MKHLKHPATIIAALALFVALGGGAAAYASGLISGKQIKNHSIPAKKLTKAAIKSLHGKQGPAGPAGATGATGPQGPAGPSSATSTYKTGGVTFGTVKTAIVSLTLPAGSYVVIGNTMIVDTTSQGTACDLADSHAGNIAQSSTTTGPSGAYHSLSIVAPLTTTGSTVDLECVGSDASASAFDTHLVAIQVGSVTGT